MLLLATETTEKGGAMNLPDLPSLDEEAQEPPKPQQKPPLSAPLVRLIQREPWVGAMLDTFQREVGIHTMIFTNSVEESPFFMVDVVDLDGEIHRLFGEAEQVRFQARDLLEKLKAAKGRLTESHKIEEGAERGENSGEDSDRIPAIGALLGAWWILRRVDPHPPGHPEFAGEDLIGGDMSGLS